MIFQDKTNLITGGPGFSGSNLVLELRKGGHELWVCDLWHKTTVSLEEGIPRTIEWQKAVYGSV